MRELADLIKPVKAKREKFPESYIQSTCVKWMRGRGYWARKFSSMSQRSVPDYLFAVRDYAPIKFACEFKGTGKKSTPAQIEEQKLMRQAGWVVFEADDIDKFKSMVVGYEGPDAGV